MFLLVSKMVPGHGINVLTEQQQKLIKRCCDNQLKSIVAAGASQESCIKTLCRFVWEDQLPSIAAFAEEDFEIPATACIIEVVRVNDMADLAGIFPDDWVEDNATFSIGAFYLDGTPA